MSAKLSQYIESRREGVMDDAERGVLDAAIKLASDRKAKILERRFKEPEIEDVEVMVPPSVRNKGKFLKTVLLITKFAGKFPVLLFIHLSLSNFVFVCSQPV